MEDTENADSGPIPTNDDASTSQGISCALCGCATPAVRCDRCNSQIFCLSCDDMYHRHPKRKLHLRKAVDSIWSSARSPRLRRSTDLPGDPSKIPIPPPRAKKRDRHAVGSRIFLKSGLELGSFGHSKVFDPKILPTSKDFFSGQKSPASLVESNCDDTSSPIKRSESAQIYENDNVAPENLNDRSPWNTLRPNISSPIQVSIPSSSPDIVANGQSFGYPMKPHSQSAADLTGHSGPPIGHQPYHFHPPYPYMHPPMHPYSHSMAHLNCAQCISSSWSNLISPHPSPYFHPMPWGSAQNAMSRHPVPGQPGPMKHSHGDLPSFPESGFHYPYPGGGYYPNGPPVVDPNFIKDLHEQAEMQKSKREVAESRSNPVNEEMDTTENPAPATSESAASNAVTSTEAATSANQDVKEVDVVPVIPEKPTEPWTCLHCTYINPPGSYICEVCCKTSYGNKPLADTEEQSEMRPLSRDSESPLINRDAVMNSPGVSELRDAQKDADVQIETQISQTVSKDKTPSCVTPDPVVKLTTETQTFTTTKTTDVQTQNISHKSMASSTDSIFPKQEISVQTEHEAVAQTVAVATDPMISSQSLESLLSGVSAPPYHNRRAGWGRGATSFSTQSLYDRGRSRSPMPRSQSFHTEAPHLVRDSSFASEEAMHSISQTWLYTDPMYYKPRYQGLGQSTKEDYFDGTWGSMDKLDRRIHKKDKGKVEHVRPKLHRSLDDLKSEKRAEPVPIPELMMLQTVKEAERLGYTLEDLHVAYLHCNRENPVYWLEDNWPQMVKNVIALAAKYGEDNEENDVGIITASEAKEALRIHRGDIWDAVTECIENRQRKILELTVRGNFTQKQISEALKNNDGNVELAYADLLRQSTRRHKFILSPGLSTDSEDLNLYNPTEDSTADHNLSASPIKAIKVDAAGESKNEKKKSDFFTKLTAIREAQSERRKAREEKELIRETITQDFPADSESNVPLKDKDLSIELTPSISREDSKEVEEPVQEKVSEEVSENVIEVLEETKTEVEITDLNKGAIDVKEGAEDNIPVDFDTNWSESQGEWIEEYSDEHWVENDEHWVGIGKKFEKMEKEYEEEAMQMAAFWEKEELEDDVFVEDAKPQDEVTNDSDKKFDEWIKANLKVDSSEYEEEVEIKEKPFSGEITDISLRERLELEGSQPSPLQHYPTAFDLSVKSQFESDWVDIPADAEIEKLAHDIVCEGSDIESKIEDADIVMYEEEKRVKEISDLGSDEDWEKIEMDEQLHEINELDRLAFPEKESEVENETEMYKGFTEEDIIKPPESTSQIMISEGQTVLYKNLEDHSVVEDLNEGIIPSDSQQKAFDKVSDEDQEVNHVNEDQPKPPVRRRSKLNSWAIEEALKNHLTSENSSDIPPALPEKMKHKDVQPTLSDIYAMPDKSAKTLHQEYSNLEVKDSQVPQKPPRLNLSPLTPKEEDVSKKVEEPEVLPKILSKDGSPVTPLSYESDSDFFADSESDTETRRHKQKNVQRKSAKYANELKDNEIELISKEEIASEDKSDLFEPNLDLELDDDIDPALIEPLPRMKDIDFDPELPILLSGRGRQLINKDDVNAPKAFREDTARPLQLFKATKRETPTNNLDTSSSVTVEQSVDFNQKANEVMPEPTSKSQMTDRYYYNETIAPQQNLNEIQLPEKQEIFDQPLPQKELISEIEMKQEIEQVQPTSIQEDEIAFTEGLSAVADYFFGQYNEVTVTPPKKKGSLRSKPSASTADKSPNSKALSASEIISAPKMGSLSQMEQSAAAVLQEEPQRDSAMLSTSDITKEISKQQNQQVNKQVNPKSAPSREETPISEKQKPPPPIECLSFAEDYLFGAYNQVVVPTKTRNVPVVSRAIPKLGASLSRTQSPHKEEKTPMVSTPEPLEQSLDEQEEEMEEEIEEEISENEENTIATDISAAYDDVFHDLPSEMLSNQSFDESSIYYESFQDAVEDIQECVPVNSTVVNMRPKSVHFEEPKVPVAPPRKNKPQGMQKAREINTVTSSESYADEYLYRQYGTQSLDKKKLPVCSEDFRMNQGFESTEIPCDVPIMPDEQQDDVISSETSVDIPLKSLESFKYSSESEFGVSEQSLNYGAIESKTVKTALELQRITTQNIDDSLIDVRASSDATSSELIQDGKSTDIQSERSESFEEISIPDLCEEVLTEPSVISCDLIKENISISNVLSSSITEPQLNNAQISQSSNVNTDESNISSDTYDIDQFVFIEGAQDIINDESYHLYDMQESLVSDLSYINIKGNIEDECTDDSEQEWKRNEDRKNTLNASFLKTASDKKDSDEHLETILDKSEEFDLYDSKNIACTDVESNFDVQSTSDVIEEDQTKSLESLSYKTDAIKLVKECESIDTSENSIQTAVVETQKIKDKTFEKVNKITEKIDESLPVASQIFENLEKVIEDTIENLSKIDDEFESKVSSSLDETEIISKKSFIGSSEKISEEIIENLPEIDQITPSKDSFETEKTQLLSDSALTETELGDPICIVEKNQNILLENFAESDGTLSTLDVIPDGSVENLSEEITESLTKINQDITPRDFSSDNTSDEIQVISKSAEDLSNEIAKSSSETDHETLLQMSSDLADIIQEKVDDSSFVCTRSSSAISEKHLESSEEIEIDESVVTVDDLFTSEDQQLELPDDAGELSDDNLSTHSSVSTQIAISLKTNVKESEGDDGSLYLEQIENFEDNEVSEESFSLPVSAERIQEDDGQNFEFVTDVEGFKKLDESQKFSKYEEHISEIENLDFEKEIGSRKDKSELTPTPSFESDAQEETAIPSVIRVSSIENHENVSEDTLKEFSLDSERVDVPDQEDTIRTLLASKTIISESSVDKQNNESVSESLKDTELIDKSINLQSSFFSGDGDDTNESDYENMKLSDLPVPDALSSEALLQVNVDTQELAKLDDIKNDEMDSESLMAEEPIMSRFYDEWYQNVESSNNFIFLSAESIYAKYGAAESSESGNESDVDNVLSSVSCEGDTQDIQKESLREITSLCNQPIEKEEESAIEKITVKKDESYDVKVCDSFNISENLKIKETKEVEISQNDVLAEKEIKLLQDQFVSKPEEEEFVVQYKTDELIKVQENTEAVNDTKNNEYIQPDKDSEVIDSRHEKNKFSTSKSCQTEDSFEEDIFFDSFDDTFTIPSYLHIPIEEQTKPSTNDMSIQCELISIEEILSSKNISGSVPQIEVITPEACVSVSIQNLSEEPKMKGEQPKESDLASDEKEESSCESFEDTDSDIFIESPSSQDELDVGVKKSFLYAEIDSDTGFSSGSEYGWTKKSVLKQKELKKGVKSLVTVIDSQQKSFTTEKELAHSSQIYAEESTIGGIQEKIVKTCNIIEESMDIENVLDESQQQDSEITSNESRASPLPREIIERAVTPIAIPQYPSFDEDLVFVEIQENVEEAANNIVEEIIPTSTTVEYFYGPLPETVKIESPSNEGYFETASEFSEPLSFSIDRTESFSESISSLQTAEPEVPGKSDVEFEILSREKDFEDESFADTISSSKEMDESISEYFPLPESSISATCRLSIAESDVFDLAQSDITPDAGFIDVITPLELDNRETDRFIEEKFQLSGSDISKNVNFVKAVDKVDKTSQEISSSSNLYENKEMVISDASTEIQSKIQFHDEESSGLLYLEKTNIDDILPEAVTEICASDTKKEGTTETEQFVASRSELTSDRSDLSETNESEPVLLDLVVPSSDLPPKPSDIVRYLYYDDSITFDEDSYLTQSENVGVPSLAAEEVKCVDLSSEEVVNESRVCVTSEGPGLLPEQLLTNEEKLTSETIDTSTNDAAENIKSVQRSSASTSQIVSEVLEISESEKLKEMRLEKDVKVSESVIEVSSEQNTFLQSDTSKDILSSCESDLKFPVVEVIASENVTVMPVTAEQIYEPIVPIEELIPEAVTVVNTPTEEKSTISEDSEFHDIPQKVFRTSPDIPSAPSDIVRYLYYDDDFTFDETTQSSFHSYSNNNASDLASDDLQPQFADFELFEVKTDVDTKPESSLEKESIFHKQVPELQKKTSTDLSKETILDTSIASHEQSSYKLDSSSAKDESFPPVDSSEFIENWFDLEEIDHKKKYHDSEHYSSTKSSALKDSEQACIPEYILSPKFDNGIPVGKTDIDEVTDISTHFTMTDDSDKFSDIESDISLNLEEECVLPIEFSDPMKIEFKEVADVDDEMIVCTPKIKNIEGGFQFVSSEASKEKFIELAVLEESLEQKYYDVSSVTTSDLAIHHSIESLESPSQNLNEVNMQELVVESNEKFDECISSTDFSEMSREHFVECPVIDDDHSAKDISQDHVEAFDDCITSTDFSELPSKQPGECSSVSEYFDQSPNQEIEQSLLEKKIDECVILADSSKQLEVNLSECLIPSESIGLESSKDILPEQKIENFDECITSTDFSEISKEQFLECLSGDLTHTESSRDIVLESAEEAFDKHDVLKEDSERLKEQFEECPDTTSEVFDQNPCEKANVYITAPESFVSDENGNYTNLVVKEDFTKCSKENKTHVVSEDLNISLQVDILKTSPDDKNDENDISCYALSENSSFDKQSASIVEAELKNISDEKPELFSQMTEIISLDQDDDLEISCYTAPNEDSHSISTEVTENWSDAESKNIEIEESVYDLPQECISDKFIENDSTERAISKVSETLTDKSESFFCETNIVETTETDILLLKSQEEIVGITDKISDCKGNINACTSADSSQTDSTVPPFSSKNMPSDISDVKMETQPEISSAMKEIHIECMSATSGVEPIFSSEGTMYDTQEVHPKEINSGDICQEEGVIIEDARREISSCSKITSCADTEGIGSTCEVGILETSESDIFEAVDIKFPDIDAKSETVTHILETTKIDETKSKEVPLIVDSKGIVCELHPENEFISSFKTDNVNKGEEIYKEIEIVDFKFVENIESITDTKLADNVTVLPDLNLNRTELVDFRMGNIESVVSGFKQQTISENEECASLKADLIVKNEKEDIASNGVSLKVDNFVDSKTVKQVLSKSLEPYETVDFKGSALIDKDTSFCQAQESSIEVSVKEKSEKAEQKEIVCCSDNSALPVVVSFKGEPGSIDSPVTLKGKEISETEKSFDKLSFKATDTVIKRELDDQPYEIVDFKIISHQYPENLNSRKEDIDQEKSLISKESTLKLNETCSIEAVDFKGQLNFSPDLLESKKEDETQNVKEITHDLLMTFKTANKEKEIFIEKTTKSDEILKTSQPEDSINFAKKCVDFVHSSSDTHFETVDFKGQLKVDSSLSEKEKDISSTLTQRESKFAEKSEISVKEKEDKKPSKSDEVSIHSSLKDSSKVVEKVDLIESNVGFETVDFRGELICSSKLKGDSLANVEEMTSEPLVDSKSFVIKKPSKVDIPSQITDSTEFLIKTKKDFAGGISETESVDFKGMIVSDKTAIQLEEREIPKDVKIKSTISTTIEDESIKLSMRKTVDHERSIYSKTGKSDKQTLDYEAVSPTDFSIYQDPVYEEVVYETDIVERYPDYISYEEPVYDLRETYGYGAPEQVASYESSGYITEENVYFDEMSVELAGFSISSEETNELYSCVETLSTDEDTSLQFNSVSDGLADSLNLIASEEFTDVPSHLTSTEGSDKWSDVEGDIFFEDTELDRDKTPIRTLDETNILKKETVDSSSVDNKVSEQTTRDIELSIENTSDQSVSVIDVYTDVASHDLSTEESEKWSDVKNVTESVEKESYVSISSDTKQINEAIPKDEKIDQVIFDKTMKLPKDIPTVETDIDTIESLTEHFADVSSLKDQSSIVGAFSSLDAKTAVSKTHEDTSTDISSQFEITESEPWLDAETEHSVSDVGEDIAFCIEKDNGTKVVFVDYEKGVDEVGTVMQSSETTYASTSSSYSDLGNSDQTSDTCADISLQGATTENSDKWSDIESEGLIDEVLYGNVDIPETADLTDLSQLRTKIEENKNINQIVSSKIEDAQSSPETTTENIALTVTEGNNKEEDFSFSAVSKSNLLETSESFSLVEGLDSSSANITDSRLISIQTESSLTSLTSITAITAGMSDDELTSVTPLDVTTEESDKWSDLSGDTSQIDEESSISLKANLKLQDQEFDSVSSKFRIDPSSKVRQSESTEKNLEAAKADDSVKKIDGDSFVLVKADSEIQESSDIVLSDSKADRREKDQKQTIVEDTKKSKPILDVSEDTSPKENIACRFLADTEDQHSLEFHQQHTIDSESSKKIADDKETSANLILDESKSLETSTKQLEADVSIVSVDTTSLSFKGDLKSQNEALDVSLSEFKLKKTEDESDSIVTESRLKSLDQIEIDSRSVQEKMKSKMLESITSQSVEEKIEDSSSGNITEESETVDNFTDVPTYTSEISDAYCELDSDHSFEDTESPLLIDPNDQNLYDVADVNNQQAEVTGQSFSEYYENSLANHELLENLEDYALDAIPENEFENYEEEYSLSEHFEINEDELIYPLPYNDDWIGQSFELKEYGVEAVFSESGSDIHGLGIGSEEFYDDEDIQRAIDYNLSTFEVNETDVENVGASESFKSLSNDASPHLKPEEYDNWSTADAPSIVEEFDEHDDVLSKIDEILAEDFDSLDNYQPESPLKIEEEIESDLLKNVSTPEEICDKKFSEKDDSSLSKNILLERDKIKAKIEPKEEILQKDLTQVLEVKSDILSNSAAIVDAKEIQQTQSKSAIVEMSSEKDSKSVLKKDTYPVSGKISLKNDKNVGQVESESCRVILQKDSRTDIESNILSDSTSVQIDSKEVTETQSERVSVETSIKKDSKSVFKDDFEAALKKDTAEKSTPDSSTVVKEKAIKEKNTVVSEFKTESLLDKKSVKESSSSIKATDNDVISKETTSKKGSLDNLKRELESVTKEATATKVSAKASKNEPEIVSKEMTVSQEIKMKSVSASDEVTIQKVQTDINKNKHETNTTETIIKTDTGGKGSKTSLDLSVKNDITLSPEVVQEIPAKLQVPAPEPDSVSLSVSKTESSLNIPCKEIPESTEISKDFSIKEKATIKSSESADIIQSSCHLNESSEYSTTVSAESVKVQSNIPEQKAYKDETFIGSKPVSDSSDDEVKPDIPKKIRSRTLDSKEEASTTNESDKKPSLPPKKSKRHSVSDSSSVSESLSSSSSVESLGSFESAVSGRSRKSRSEKSSDETSMHSASPEVPARRSRSSKASSSSRSTSRDSDDSGSIPSRSSSLKIRRRSSNFIEPEPIDLSKKRASIDERIKKLQNEGKCTSREKAFIAAKLIEMQFEEEDALLASRQCNTVYNAVKFLTQLCEMCNCRFPINLMASMVQCAHRACKECLKAHFTSLIYDRSVFTLLCPICHNSDITDQNIQDYFNHLEMTLRNILEDKVYDLFQRKLRDEVLTKDPNFHWCSQCSSGFIASPRLKKLYCPDCSAITCALCHQTWELEHEGVHCERFQQWKDMHTPEPPPAGLVKFLVDRGISCPSCGLVYEQACGGCLMYKCSHCSFEFCGFCSCPLKRGRECANDICDSRGLHIHHLHNCLFFLRDKDITEIQMLLEEESVTYLTIPPKDQIVKSRCQVREQKINHGVLTEDRCGRDIEPYCGGLCRTHYYEYLAELLRKNNISPLSIMSIQDLQFMLRKSRVLVPEKVKGETSEEYYERLLNVVTSTLT